MSSTVVVIKSIGHRRRRGKIVGSKVAWKIAGKVPRTQYHRVSMHAPSLKTISWAADACASGRQASTMPSCVHSTTNTTCTKTPKFNRYALDIEPMQYFNVIKLNLSPPLSTVDVSKYKAFRRSNCIFFLKRAVVCFKKFTKWLRQQLVKFRSRIY